MTDMQNIEDTVKAIFSKQSPRLRNEEVSISLNTDFRRELEFESLSLLSVLYHIERDLGVDLIEHTDELAKAIYIGDVLDIVLKLIVNSDE